MQRGREKVPNGVIMHVLHMTSVISRCTFYRPAPYEGRGKEEREREN